VGRAWGRPDTVRDHPPPSDCCRGRLITPVADGCPISLGIAPPPRVGSDVFPQPTCSLGNSQAACRWHHCLEASRRCHPQIKHGRQHSAEGRRNGSIASADGPSANYNGTRICPALLDRGELFPFVRATLSRAQRAALYHSPREEIMKRADNEKGNTAAKGGVGRRDVPPAG
jgi:hypothetical protein